MSAALGATMAGHETSVEWIRTQRRSRITVERRREGAR